MVTKRLCDELASGSRTFAAGETVEILHFPDLVKKIHMENVNALNAIRDTSDI